MICNNVTKASAELTAEERIEQLRKTTEEMITSRTEYVESTRLVGGEGGGGVGNGGGSDEAGDGDEDHLDYEKEEQQQIVASLTDDGHDDVHGVEAANQIRNTSSLLQVFGSPSNGRITIILNKINEEKLVKQIKNQINPPGLWLVAQ